MSTTLLTPLEPPRQVARVASPTIMLLAAERSTGSSAHISVFDRRQIAGYLVSLVTHLVLLVLFALFSDRSEHGTSGVMLVLDAHDQGEHAFDEVGGAASLPTVDIDATAPAPESALAVELAATNMPRIEMTDRGPAHDDSMSSTAGAAVRIGRASEWSLPIGPPKGAGGITGRGPEPRAQAIRDRGGSRATEDAVVRGLKWLAAHQRRDGGWSFDHSGGLCQGQCRHPGNHASTTAATGLALLCFLGRNETHRSGEFQDVVARGLYYLTGRMLATPRGGDLQEGTMYGHGIAAIAICEAYALTGDPELARYAQLAADFTVNAQDPQGGGWRYTPGEPGDTTMLGWQLMAIKSGDLAGLKIPTKTWYNAQHFLDSVQTDGGAKYGYRTPVAEPTTTAIGLLARMYGGWSQSHPALERGVKYLGQQAPSRTNLYFDYYATQVLFHWGGESWDRWNGVLREHLLRTQATTGHEAGSWWFDDPKTATAGGRLYNTALATMILEVYYRYLPLYGQGAVGPDFGAGD